MELRQALKSLVALGTGATLVGATVLSALAAASLSTYPAPFIKDGKFDALIVVGANAASIDTLGAIDIATSMQAANTVTKTVPGTSSTVTVEGDAFRLDSGSDALEKGEDINAVGTTTLTSSNLKALAGGKITNAKGTFDYSEQITVPASMVDFTVDPDDSTDTPKWYLKFDTAENPYVYKVIFTPALESDITSGTLDDIEDKSITLLGKTYDVVNADGSIAAGSVTLDLMAGAAKDTIAVGETKTYSVGAKDYEVTLTYAEAGKAKFTVNGVSTNLIAAGDTDVLSDGTELGLSEVLYQGYAGGIQSAEFYIGATKIRLKDTDTNTDVTGDTTVTHGSNTVTDVTTRISGTNTSTIKINSITLTWLADEDIYIPADGKLSTSKGNDDNQMFLNFDVEFKGIEEDSSKDTIDIVGVGDDEYKLKFTNKAGNQLDVPAWDVDALVMHSGNENYDLIVGEGSFNDTGIGIIGMGRINKNDYFVVSDAAGKNTYLMRYTSVDSTENTVTFQESGSGTDQVVSYSALAGTLVLGGADYDFVLDVDSNGANVSVDLDASGAIVNGTIPVWYTKYGAKIFMPTPGDDASILNITSEKGGDIVTTNGEMFSVLFTNTTADTIELGAVAGVAGLQTIGDGNNKEDYTAWGTHLYQTYAESGPDKLTITYPDDQTEILAYYTSGATTSTSTTGGSTYQEVVPISVDAAVLDTEVADFSAQNLIIVGGPCVNLAAADAMGNPAVCTTGFVEGKAMVKLYERTNGKVALLVAGYSGMDTRRASRAVAEYKKHAFAGTELDVTGTSLTQYTVTKTA